MDSGLIDWVKQFVQDDDSVFIDIGDGTFAKHMVDVHNRVYVVTESEFTHPNVITTATFPNETNISFIRIQPFSEHEGLSLITKLNDILDECNFPPFIFTFPTNDTENQAAAIAFCRSLGYNVVKLMGAENSYLAADNLIYRSTRKRCAWRDNMKKAEDFLGQKEYAKAASAVLEVLRIVPDKQKYLAHHLLGKAGRHLHKDMAISSFEAVTRSNGPFDFRNASLKEYAMVMEKLPFFKRKSYYPSLPAGFKPSTPCFVPRGKTVSSNFVDDMLIRGVNYSINDNGSYDIRHPEGKVVTRNFFLSGAELVSTSPLQRPSRIQGMEDVRLFGDNQFFCCCADVNDQGVPQMCYGSYNDGVEVNGVMVKQVTCLVPQTVATVLQCEKNWLPMAVDDEVHFIYSITPLVIGKVGQQPCEIIYRKEFANCHRDIRGSAVPIEYNNGWLFTAHQVHYAGYRNYFHRIMWMSKDYTTIKASNLFYFDSPDIEYNVSIAIRKNKLYFAYSTQDNHASVASIPMSVVESMMQSAMIYS